MLIIKCGDNMSNTLRTVVSMLLAMLMLLPLQANSQQDTQTMKPAFTQEQIEQLVAPIALYPDALVAQILMASTYPLEIVSADRWMKANPNLKDKALEDALQQQPWDASVKSLVAIPQVLDMLNQKLDMTQQLGDAFLEQQKEVLDAVQRLRAKAQDKGNLNTTKEQVVNKTEQSGSSIITIEPANPEVIYVPVYDPNVVYGAWAYPSYPPYYYYPPNYNIGTALISFGAGLAVGNAIWGNCNWHNGNVDINVNRYNSFNRTNITDNNWRHDPAHREGVPYYDKAMQQKYGKDQLKNNEAREQFRGRAEQGQQELKRQNDLNRNDAQTRQNDRGTNAQQRDKQNLKGSSAKQQNRAKQNTPHSDVNRARPGNSEVKQRGGAQRQEFRNEGRGSMENRGGARMEHRGGGGRHR